MSILVGAAFDIAANLIGSVTGPLAALVNGGIQAAGEAAGAAGAGAAAAAADTAAVAGAAQPEEMERRLRFLSWAYTAVWLILAAYLLLLSVRQRRLERLLRQLRDRVPPPGPTSRL